MTIRLARETEQQLLESIKRFFFEQFDDGIGDLKAALVLEFCVKEIGPSIYNGAIADAQARLQEAVADLEGSCHEPEFGYWSKR
jgi:uncharacterized protein (DUF2164 family)